MFKMIAKGIEVDMYIGICDFEYEKKQKVIVNVIAYGQPAFEPKDISECLDYSKVCNLVHSWTNREHVDLVETLLAELIEFCFQDSRIDSVDIEVLKPDIIPGTEYVGVGAIMSREQFIHKQY